MRVTHANPIRRIAARDDHGGEVGSRQSAGRRVRCEARALLPPGVAPAGHRRDQHGVQSGASNVSKDPLELIIVEPLFEKDRHARRRWHATDSTVSSESGRECPWYDDRV